MTLKQLTYFIALSRSCHFSNTANEIFVSQSTLSHSISDLEDELGVKLFHRNGNNVTLTSYGEYYAKMINPILDSLRMANSHLTEMSLERLPQIRVGIFPSLYTRFSRGIIEGYNSLHPADQVNVVFCDRKRTSDLIEEVEYEVFDMTFSTIIKDQMCSAELFRQFYYFCAPDSHPLAEKESVSFEDIKNEDFIVVARHMASRPFIDSIFDSRGVDMRVVMEQLADQFSLNYVAAGYGCTIIPYEKAYELEGVKCIPIDDPDFRRTIYLVWKNDETLSDEARSIRDYIIENSERIYLESIK